MIVLKKKNQKLIKNKTIKEKICINNIIRITNKKEKNNLYTRMIWKIISWSNNHHKVKLKINQPSKKSKISIQI